jgi:ComEC/Rec2-related protein
MIWSLILIFCFGAYFGSSIYSELQSFALFLQSKCAAWIPIEMAYRHLSQSFVCGVPLSNEQHRMLFQETSLLHLMVVSGGHLQLLSLFILAAWPPHTKDKLFSRLALLFFLFSYCLLTGLQAPVVRSFFGLLLFEISHRFRWNWDSGKTQLFTGLLLLFLIPHWIFHFSFYLSWLASLGFLLSPLIKKGSPNLWQKWLLYALCCFLIQTLLTLSFGNFNAIGVVTNSLFAPILGILLFPISLAPAVFPFLSLWADRIWALLISGLQMIQQELPQQELSQVTFSERFWMALWIFLAAVHAGFECLRRLRFRGFHA